MAANSRQGCAHVRKQTATDRNRDPRCDYKRHDTTTLFAAPEAATGKIIADACYPRHRHQEFLRFLAKVAAAHPGVPLHVVCDNHAVHKHSAVKTWLNANPRDILYFTHRRLQQRPLPAVYRDQ